MGGGPPVPPAPAAPPAPPAVPLLPGVLQSESVPAANAEEEDVPPTTPPEIKGMAKGQFQLRKSLEREPTPRDPNPLAIPLTGIAGETGAPPVIPGSPGYDELQDTLKGLGIARPETTEEAKTAIRNELAGSNRSRFEIMTAMPPSGGVMQESAQRRPMSSLPQRGAIANALITAAQAPGAVYRGVADVLGDRMSAERTAAQVASEAYARPAIAPFWDNPLTPAPPRETMAWLDAPGVLRSKLRMK
jgi:hypothetical protein